MYMVKTGREEDAAGVLAVIRAIIATGFEHWDDDYPTLDMLVKDARHGGLLILCDGERIVGGISIVYSKRLLDELNSPRMGFTQCEACMLARLAILPEFQHGGLGTRLIECAIEEAKRRGVRAARLLAASDNDGAIRLYSRLGFTYTGSDAPFEDAGEYVCYEMLF